MTNDLVGTFNIAAKDGSVSGEMHRWMKGQQRQADGKAGKTQTAISSWFVEFPQNKAYRVIINAPVGFTINAVTTRSTVGTATLTVRVDGVNLGGAANSVSTAEQTQAHSSANVVAAGQDVELVFSSVSGAQNVSVTLNCTVTLA